MTKKNSNTCRNVDILKETDFEYIRQGCHFYAQGKNIFSSMLCGLMIVVQWSLHNSSVKISIVITGVSCNLCEAIKNDDLKLMF